MLKQTAALLSSAEERELFIRVRDGDMTARDKIVLANLRLVTGIAKSYRCVHLSNDDLVQEGIIGLITAISHFDHTLGNRFATYATYQIRRSISRAIEKSERTISLTGESILKARRVEEISERFLAYHQREPTTEELAELTGYDLLSIGQARAQPYCYSLDALLDGRSDCDEKIADPASVNDNKLIDRLVLEHQIEQIRNIARHALSELELAVIRHRFGIDTERKTLDRIAKELEMSHEGVRHVEKRALRKLREHFVRTGT